VLGQCYRENYGQGGIDYQCNCYRLRSGVWCLSRVPSGGAASFVMTYFAAGVRLPAARQAQCYGLDMKLAMFL